jgi:CheY-like chemotaxis protein
LFKEIVQFDAAKLQQGKGSGIGLWSKYFFISITQIFLPLLLVSNKIMKLHGGRIGVDSEGEGLGSTFYIDIPILRTQITGMATNRPQRSTIALREMLRSMIANDPQGFLPEDMPTQRMNSINNLQIHDDTPAILHSLQPHPSQTALQPSSAPAQSIGTAYLGVAIHKPRRILIVDDSTVNRKMLKKYVQSHFDECDEASNGLDALNKIELWRKQYMTAIPISFTPIAAYTHSSSPTEHRSASAMSSPSRDSAGHPTTELITTAAMPLEAFGYDVIILDYFMPEMNGLEVMEELQRMKYPGKVVGLTGNTENSMKEAFLAAGADMVLIKPLQGEDLQRIIHGTLSRLIAMLLKSVVFSLFVS